MKLTGKTKKGAPMFLHRTTIYPLAKGLTGHYVLQIKENKDEKKCTVIFEKTVLDTKEDRETPKKYYSLQELNELGELKEKIQIVLAIP